MFEGRAGDGEADAGGAADEEDAGVGEFVDGDEGHCWVWGGHVDECRGV